MAEDRAPQTCKRDLKGPDVRFSVFHPLQIAAELSQTAYQYRGQSWDQEGQLPFSQGADRLKGLQIAGRPPRIQIWDRPQQSTGASLQKTTAAPRPPDRTPFSKGPLSLLLPDSQIVVVQQPLRRLGLGAPLRAPLGERLMSLKDRP